ncbi:MAG: flagellar biosynthesis protein FlhA [Nitrospirae bacterium]|nr:flagellar biosynthesis protein FlhA [Nitrospirota bacterium]
MPKIKLSGEVALALAIVMVLGIMIIPLPQIILDVLLTLSIAIAIMILLISTYIKSPMEFSIFPALLLIVTLFRLSLNIASTRLILLHGDEGVGAAGEVIKAFGSFVVGGNFAVGAIVFLILVVINFVVITKGAGRIAEVAARFTLDALPGKQMSIDADLNAGLLDETQARRRRKEVAQEADFYGAMDGASKFVRGDAVAAIVIMAVNIVGGLLIGIIQKGMDAGTAATTYTILTIGEGLVAQIPALIVSTAAGIVVSRSATENSLSTDIATQVIFQPKALGTTSGVLAMLGLVPGLPHIPFLLLAAGTGTGAYLLASVKAEAVEEIEAMPPPAAEPEPIEALLPLDVLALEIGYGLISLVEEEGLLGRIKAIRRQEALDMGFIVPPIHIKDNLSLRPNEYSLLIKGVEVAGGEVMPGQYMALNPGGVRERLEGSETREPTYGLPALWISERQVERAQLAGYTVVDPSTVIATHITEVLKLHAADLLGKQETQGLFDNFAKTNPKAVEEVVPNLMTLGMAQRVLQDLLRERVSIRDLGTILETLAEYGQITKDHEVLADYARQALARNITKQYQSMDGTLLVMSLEPALERKLGEALQSTARGSYLALEPAMLQKMLEKIRALRETTLQQGYQAVLLCSPLIRRPLKKLTERVVPGMPVLSHNELLPSTKLQSVGVVRVSDEN